MIDLFHWKTREVLTSIDPANDATASRIVEIQRAAYAVEAELIGFDGIPLLTQR